MKKIIALILSVVLVLGLLAGCGNEPAKQTDPATQDSLPAGMVVLSAGAAVSITYDAEGLVLEIAGASEEGEDLIQDYTGYVGKTCAVVSKELIDAAAKAGFLTADTKNIVIKQSIRSELPGTHFLETIETEVKTAAEAAGAKAVITVIDESKLDENGYINLETAQALLCNELGVEKLDQYYGAQTPTDGVYICTAEIAGKQTYHHIDAITGLIQDATDEELLGETTDETEIPEEVDEETPVVEDPEEDIEVPVEPTENVSIEEIPEDEVVED